MNQYALHHGMQLDDDLWAIYHQSKEDHDRAHSFVPLAQAKECSTMDKNDFQQDRIVNNALSSKDCNHSPWKNSESQSSMMIDAQVLRFELLESTSVKGSKDISKLQDDNALMKKVEEWSDCLMFGTEAEMDLITGQYTPSPYLRTPPAVTSESRLDFAEAPNGS